ncbi:sigma factor-like helix-turn-helix DNA-binding protein [Streptomyces sp. NPDC096339]|uniref:sigma factor-like helix-turn-helix DNA-binding protein n=1 Tax=Streptomyces sp. NPDC096339 TaxID=3366086 RepID=UPI0037F9AC11
MGSGTSGTSDTGGTGGTGDGEYLAARFEERRGRLLAVAERMLGSADEAREALQEVRRLVEHADAGWLTGVVARVCLDRLRARAGVLVLPSGRPEREGLLADSVALGLLVVLDQLAPAERLSFVLHDLFGMPFEEVAPIVERSPEAARQLAIRARRRVRGGVPEPEADPFRQREIVEAFLAAAREGSFEDLTAVLDPDVVLRVDEAETAVGAGAVARQALTFQRLAPYARPALVNGVPGAVTIPPGGRTVAAMGFTVGDDRIVAIDISADPARLAALDVTSIDN